MGFWQYQEKSIGFQIANNYNHTTTSVTIMAPVKAAIEFDLLGGDDMLVLKPYEQKQKENKKTSKPTVSSIRRTESMKDKEFDNELIRLKGYKTKRVILPTDPYKYRKVMLKRQIEKIAKSYILS